MSNIRMFEVYLYSDQLRKDGFGGHVRFIAAPSEHDASHRIAFEWGHWWRLCGIREVDMDYWSATHATLEEGKTSHIQSRQAYEDYMGSTSATNF